jgi:GDPmannose 4,6-dehydratase
MQKQLLLGNMEAKRDWGFAPEYCEGMWRILQHEKAEDFVLATGETQTVRRFAELTFNNLGFELEWKGKGIDETGIIKTIDLNKAKELIGYSSQPKDDQPLAENKKSYLTDFTKELKLGDVVIAVDPNYYRPTEVDLLIGDASKAEKLLGWKAKTKFEELVKIMIKSDMDKVLKRGF